MRVTWAETEGLTSFWKSPRCAEIGRDPASVTRSIHLPIAYDQPDITQDAIGKAIDAGFQHIVLGLPAPYPEHVGQWVADELITPTV